ncbi:MAG: hypothetical protein BGN91_00445 [Nitrobacter sp. 62-13]|nr:XRE family transcriptional regulator [Nitrobacter sp. 62-13]OJU25284.1 MAG: hypothetical protein BGN91_00445 [Nitrobacter sp. 62-13]
MITGSQCRAARALVEISRPMLARRSEVSVDAIERFENVSGSLKRTEIQAIRETLEKLGAVFIPENGSGYGVRLKFNNLEAAEIARFECEGGLVADDRVP